MGKFILSNGQFVWSKKTGNGFATATPPPPPPTPNYLCFTAEEAGSTIELTALGSPSIANTAYSRNGTDWTTFTPAPTAGPYTIKLNNVGDKVYFRNDITANFSTSDNLRFVMSGKIAASGNCNSMYIHEGFENLTTLTFTHCYYCMFAYCVSLTTAPKLPATTLASNCYSYMFFGCTNIKMSLTYDAVNYPNTYTFGAIPGAVYGSSMFSNTGGSFTGTPTVKTLYTSNTPPAPPYEPPVKVDTDLRPTQFMEITRNNNDLEVK